MNDIDSYFGIEPNEDGNGFHCSKCGCNTFTVVGHIDGRDFYANSLECTNCNSPASITYKRNKADRKYW